MASRRSAYEIAGLVFVTIILIVLLVLVSITFTKVNNPPSSPEEPGNRTTPTLPTRTTSGESSKDVPYAGTMGTQQLWVDALSDPESDFYKSTAAEYVGYITEALNTTYPDAVTTVNGFDEQSAPTVQLGRKVNGKAAADDTVNVLFTTVIPNEKGDIITPDDVQNTINEHIGQTGCDGCNVTQIEVITSTAGTTSTPRVPRTTTTGRVNPLTPDEIAAEYIKSNLDRRHDPCEDFYNFACGNFANNHSIRQGAVGYGTFDLVQDRVGDIILKNLRQINVSDPNVHDWQAKTKRFYDSCKEKNQTGINHNKQLLKYIDELGGWPMIMEKGTWDEKKFNLAEVVANLTSKFSVQTLVSADVDLDWLKPDKYLVQLDQSTLALGNAEFYTHPKFAKDRRDYLEMIRQSAAILTFDQDMPQNDERVRLAADEILDFETRLAFNIVSEDHRQNYTDMYNPEILHDIQTTYGFMDWSIYFNRLLPKVVTDEGVYQGPANLVEPGYLKFLNIIVSGKSKEQLANYLVWRLVFSLNVFIDDNVQRMVSRFRATSRIGVTGPISDRDDQCVTLIINNIGFAASRLLIDGTLAENDLNNIAVKNMTDGLKESFKAQLDTLFWMDDVTRKIAKDKLDNYVELAGFPTWIENPKKLDKYYEALSEFPDRFRFLNNYVDLLTFHEETRFRVLVDPKVQRDTWIMAPAIVNAWYQPDFNSITFPSGILRPPFFKHDFPKYVNYGSLGTVIGHEITHGFDDQGIQFNGTGALEMWMSAKSRLGFKRMVECVIRQYDHTCFTQVDMCIDGTQTQGENTADNGGIRESYNAYRQYVYEHGEEPRLKGLEEFSPDQMFFLSFANVWCGDYETKEYLENQLVNNVHSPPPARVKNTLKNFDQFGKTWHCEAGQTYYPFPSEACDVWDSPLVSNNTEYKHTADRLLASMNDTIRPCENFFEHACGNYPNIHKPPSNATFLSIDILQRDIFYKIIAKLDNVTETDPMALKNAKTYFDICRAANNSERINNTEVLYAINHTLGGWPALGDKLSYTTANAKTYLSAQVGKLANNFGIQTLLVASPTVDPGDTSRTILALDQSSLALGAREYYTEDKLQNVTDAYYNLIVQVLLILSESQSGQKLPHQNATDCATQIYRFERQLALLTRPDKDRRNFTLMYNLFNDTDANAGFRVLDLPHYLDALMSTNADLTEYFTQPNASIVVSEPSFFDDLGDLITQQSKEDITTVQNYLVWRFTYSRLQFMEDELKQLYTDFQLLKQGVNELPPAETDCVSQLATMLGYTVGRLYIEDWDKNGESWRSDASAMITNITEAFDETIPELDWMDVRSQQGAKTKVNNLIKNPGYPDWIMDDKILNDYYAEYTINATSSYFDVFNQLNQYAMIKAFEAILAPVDRHDFQMSPAIVNAWYNPSLNSLTVPAAFLNPPFYHPEYPTAVKYGAIGAVMGHELTHAFDDSGIQFNGDGLLDLWMTQYSRDSYDTNVVDCVINEYNHYCHFDGEFCVDGERTQGENIADNGGIRQAFRAYRNHIREELRRNGHEDELLPRMEWYTDDQLFFYSYAQLWCGYYSDESVRRQLLTDVHSPGMDRVKGVVQNSVDFAKAFHCEVNTPMNPEDKCYVWADPIDTTEGYDKAAKGLLESLDPSTEPCDDFYQYACGGWINRHPIPKDASTISTNSLTANAVILATADGISNINVNDKTIPDAFKKTKQMYDYCIEDLSNTNSTSLESFQQYVNEQLGQWPIITKYWMPPPTVDASEQVFGVVGKLGKLGLSTLLTAYPQPEFTVEKSKPRRYALYVDQASLLLGNRKIYLDDTFADVMMKYKDVLVLTAVKFANQYNAEVPIQNIISDVDDIIKFETELARLSLPDALLENYTLQNNVRNLTELENDYPNINFTTFFNELLPAEFLPLNKSHFKIILSEPTFLAGLNNILPYIDGRTIQNYLIWRYVIDSASLLGSDMKAILRDLKRKTDFVEELSSDVSTCTQDAIALLPYAAGRLYVEKAFGSEKDRIDIEDKARKLIVEIVDQFRKRLRKLDWLDEKSTAHAEEKLDELIANVGYPDWTFNNTIMDEVYSLTINTSQDYYTTKREVSEWFYQQRFGVLKQTTDVRRENFQSSPATQNAWYQPWLNSLTIPAGEIQIPFYATNYPSAVNFGGLGAIAGHELTHGFDDDGVQFGPDGLLDYWITPESASYFKENISQCIVDQYDQYCYSDLPTGRVCINGKVTQGENIADNGGTKTAFNAYVEWVNNNGYEALLPGMESFTMDQIFFLNFARSWCGSIKPEALEKQLLLDVHSPAKNRVIGTLSNMKEFHDAFSCKVGDNMYPEHTCDVW